MNTLINILVFIFGAMVGSFLNVVIYRYNTGESIIKGSSRCFKCGKDLKWHELIPVISFLIQKGRCRKCKSKISWQYPLIEIISGGLFLLVVSHQYSVFRQIDSYFLFSTLYFLVIFSLLLVVSGYDFRHQIIPNKFVYPFIVLSFFSPLVTRYLLLVTVYRQQIVAGLLLFAFFAFLWLISRGKWMGLGDAKLALGIGFLLGLSKGILASLLAFWIGAVVGILLLIFQKTKYNMKSAIPFGSFLALGTLIAFLFGNNIINFYLYVM